MKLRPKDILSKITWQKHDRVLQISTLIKLYFITIWPMSGTEPILNQFNYCVYSAEKCLNFDS